MSAKVLKGKPVADSIFSEISSEISALARMFGTRPKLATIRVGNKPDDIAYERSAAKRCEHVGMDCEKITFPTESSDDDIIEKIIELNSDNTVDGILLLRPLPKHLNEKKIIERMDPVKDVDGVTSKSMAGLYSGSGVGYAPCTARACLEILHFYGVPIEGKNAVVVGRSTVIGKPVAMLLIAENATVTVCHSRTRDVSALTKAADIVIAAVGRKNMFDCGYFSGKQVVIDVGINVDAGGNVTGDVDFDSAIDNVMGITPVPAGVGSVTTAVLCKQTLEAYKMKHGSKGEKILE